MFNTSWYFEDTFDLTKVTSQDVYFAFTIKLPFRFRVENFFHCSFVKNDNSYDIWIKNKPLETTNEGMINFHSMWKKGEPIENIWSTAVIISTEGNITLDDLNKIKSCNGDIESVVLDSRNEHYGKSLQALNDFIIAYHMTTGELFGGQRLHVLTHHEYFERLTWEITIIGIPLTYWKEQTIHELFDLKPTREFKSMQLTGELNNIAPEELTGIKESIERLNNFYFYELAFEAKAKMVNSEYIGALLMAVAALEGVHSALVINVLKEKLPKLRTGDDKSLEEKFIMELGFSLCNRLTPYIFMDETERPPQDLIHKVTKAIKFRNEIMHALRDSAGKYKIKKATNSDICDAYSSVLQLYDYYRKAFEGLRAG